MKYLLSILSINFLISQVYISGNPSLDNIYLTETDSSYCTILRAVALDEFGESLGNIPITFSITNSEYGFLSEPTVYTSADTTSYFLASNQYCTFPGISPPDILTTIYVQIEAPNPSNPNTNLSNSFSFNLIKEYEITSNSVSIESSYYELPTLINDSNIFSSIITATATDSLGLPVPDNTLFIFNTLNDTLNQVGSINQYIYSDNGQVTSIYSLNYPVNFIGNQTISVEVPQFNIADSLNICIQAEIDECGECNGSGPPENFDCDGNCLVDIDCLGECGGSSIIDECNICNGPGAIYECGCENEQLQCRDLDGDGFGTNEFTFTTCDIEGDIWVFDCEDLDDSIYCESNQNDCAGLLCGDTAVDECGICGGDNSSCLDCSGIPNGDSLEDDCGQCDNNSSNDCIQDCSGEWGGTAIADECGICNGNGIQEYYADWDGDGYGDCDSVYLFCPNDTTSWVSDVCGDCDNGDTDSIFEDCFDICGGTAVIDDCGVCDGENASMDCEGVCGGNAEVDECGICSGNETFCNEECADLFISEIAEASPSTDSYIELYNGTSENIELNDYSLAIVKTNNSGVAENYWIESFSNESIPPESTFLIIRDTNSDIVDLLDSNYVFSANLNQMSGDDAIELRKDGVLIDTFGDRDNLTSWNIAGVQYASYNHTLVRKPDVCGGNIDWSLSAGTDSENSEWLVFDANTFAFGGNHYQNNNLIFYEYGCTDEESCNYDLNANIDGYNSIFCDYNCIEGDLNGDGTLNVIDIVALVNLILDENSQYNPLADLNDDGNINVIDIVQMVNLILT